MSLQRQCLNKRNVETRGDAMDRGKIEVELRLWHLSNCLLQVSIPPFDTNSFKLGYSNVQQWFIQRIIFIHVVFFIGIDSLIYILAHRQGLSHWQCLLYNFWYENYIYLRLLPTIGQSLQNHHPFSLHPLCIQNSCKTLLKSSKQAFYFVCNTNEAQFFL